MFGGVNCQSMDAAHFRGFIKFRFRLFFLHSSVCCSPLISINRMLVLEWLQSYVFSIVYSVSTSLFHFSKKKRNRATQSILCHLPFKRDCCSFIANISLILLFVFTIQYHHRQWQQKSEIYQQLFHFAFIYFYTFICSIKFVRGKIFNASLFFSLHFRKIAVLFSIDVLIGLGWLLVFTLLPLHRQKNQALVAIFKSIVVCTYVFGLWFFTIVHFYPDFFFVFLFLFLFVDVIGFQQQ